MNTKTITSVTLWVNRLVAVVVAALIFTLPALLNWYAGLLGYHPPQWDIAGIAVAFDLCAVAMLVALWNMEKLLQNIRGEKIFVTENVKRVKCVRWCCGVVALISLAATFFALPMLIFAAIMGFLCLVVSVVSCVLEAAVAIREENDLTI